MNTFFLALTLAVSSQAFFKPGQAPPSAELDAMDEESLFADDEVEEFVAPTTGSPISFKSSVVKKCGIRHENGIFKGVTIDKRARFAEFNWAVPIFEVLWDGKENYTGTGSLIHPQVVLSVGHYYSKTRNLKIRAGDWHIKREGELLPHQSIYVSSVVVHPLFSKKLRYDVALLFLSSPVNTEPANVGFACLPVAGTVTPAGKPCIVTGWGKHQFEGGEIAEILKMVEVPMVDDEVCEDSLRAVIGQAFNMHKSWLCAGGEVGKDACLGDGGGPLICPYATSKNQYYQAGIVSWGHDCGLAGVPGVYTDVAEVRPWIDEQMIAKGYDTSTYTP